MLNTFTVVFIGHRYIESSFAVEKKLDRLIADLLGQHEYVEFLVGRDGEFDQLAASAVRRAKRVYGSDNSALVWVMAYESAEYKNNEASFDDYYDEIEICDKSAQSHFKAAIQIRNQNMVDRSDMLIAYVSRDTGGAAQAVKYAVKRGKKIINLAMKEDN